MYHISLKNTTLFPFFYILHFAPSNYPKIQKVPSQESTSTISHRIHLNSSFTASKRPISASVTSIFTESAPSPSGGVIFISITVPFCKPFPNHFWINGYSSGLCSRNSFLWLSIFITVTGLIICIMHLAYLLSLTKLLEIQCLFACHLFFLLKSHYFFRFTGDIQSLVNLSHPLRPHSYLPNSFSQISKAASITLSIS